MPRMTNRRARTIWGAIAALIVLVIIVIVVLFLTGAI